MGIVVDLIIVVILAGCIITGIKKGLTGSIIKLVSFIVALVLAFMLYKPVAATITKNTQIDENIQNTIIQTFSKEKEETPGDSSQEQNMPTKFVQDINSKIENETTDARNKIVEETAKTTTTTIINIGSGIIVFIVARILLVIVSLFAKTITNLPIISQIDKIGGLAYGAVEGMLVIYIVLGLISLTSLIWANNSVVTAVTKSTIASILYNNNIILNILLK